MAPKFPFWFPVPCPLSLIPYPLSLFLQISLVQCAHREAATSTFILQYWHSLVTAAAVAGAGLMNALLMRHTTKPIIRKSISAPTK